MGHDPLASMSAGLGSFPGGVTHPYLHCCCGPLSHFSGCKVSSLVRRILCGIPCQCIRHSLKSTNGDFGRSIVCRKGKSISRISIYSGKDKALSFTQRKWSNVANLPPGCWLVIPGNGAISGGSVLVSVLGISGTQQQL